MSDRKKIAVVCFNLGGPDSLAAVEPFLFNLFKDKAIIRVPNPMRWLLAKLISKRRAPLAQEIYASIGGSSPLRPETEKQLAALEKALSDSSIEYKTFIAMRYWYPFSHETVAKVKDFNPDKIVLLPLYPQYSTTTSQSSFNDWDRCAAKEKLDKQTTRICCFPNDDNFVKAHAKLIKKAIEEIHKKGAYRILFSAHGLPKKIAESGDPYVSHVEESVDQIVSELRREKSLDALDYSICYQSRVGPLEWVRPDTESEIARAGKDLKNIILVPIAFVSEHSETLAELDIEYAKFAAEKDVLYYKRVPALSIEPLFIESLRNLVISATMSDAAYCTKIDKCARQNSECPHFSR